MAGGTGSGAVIDAGYAISSLETPKRPDAVDLPLQGWKIHAAACMDNAPRILDAVWDYCVPRGINFKFLRSPSALVSRVSKYAPRGYSGKLSMGVGGINSCVISRPWE